MPLNYASVDNAAQKYAEQALKWQAQNQENAKQLRNLFTEASADPKRLRELIEFAEQEQNTLYAAKPLNEDPLRSFPITTLPEKYSLIAADGSQIVPSRHRSLQFGLVNVGLFKVCFGSMEAPEIKLVSTLLDYDEIVAEDNTLLGEDDISLNRDLKERSLIRDEVSPQLPRPVLTLTDGPLDLFYRSNIKGPTARKAQKQVFDLDQEMQKEGILSAGYIDKPGSALIHKMLDEYCRVQGLSKPELNSKKAQVSDRILLAKIIKPSERSALFEIVSKQAGNLSDRLKVAFFYLNVSTSEEQPWLARVEIPLWIAENPELVSFIHSAIFQDAQVLDSHPYPYSLHRSHELAIVKQNEVDELENILLSKIPPESGFIATRSNKAHAKELTGK